MNIEVVEAQAQKVKPMVYAKVPPEDAGDVMQDIRISFLTSLDKHRGDSSLETFAHTIAKRRIADYWKQKEAARRPIRALIENYKTAGKSVDGGEDEDVVVGNLSRTEREVFRLLGLGLSNTEIAEVVHRSENTIRVHVKAVYRKLGCRDRVKVALTSRRIFDEEGKLEGWLDKFHRAFLVLGEANGRLTDEIKHDAGEAVAGLRRRVRTA